MDFTWQEVEEKFKQIWGYDNFRHPQKEIICTLLRGKDGLVVLPTGVGKSICFQLPALLQTGLTIVVSPLLALMENQVADLKQLGLSGELLHSQLSSKERQQTLDKIARQQLHLLYLSPETLLSKSVWSIIAQSQIKITGIIIDEAHCLTQWGTTFRPAYRRLGAVRRSLLKSKPPGTKIAIAAFTATADPEGQREITRVLELKHPAVFLVNPYRSNLSLSIKSVWTPRGRRQSALKFIQTRNQQSGLVYARSRQASEILAQWFKSLNYRVAAYHAGLTTERRREVETSWLTGELQFVISTSAFGMGIDKRDCDWVIHYHAPELLGEYVQEVGRSGRDGQHAEALTLISEPTGWLNPEDKQRSQFFRRQLEGKYRQAQQLAIHLPSEGTIAGIRQEFPQGEMVLGILHSLGLIYWQDPFSYRKCAVAIAPKSLSTSQKRYQQQMQQYLKTKKCRWQYIRQSFGFGDLAGGWNCGHCDNCNRTRK